MDSPHQVGPVVRHLAQRLVDARELPISLAQLYLAARAERRAELTPTAT